MITSKFTPELVSGRDMGSHSWGKPGWCEQFVRL